MGCQGGWAYGKLYYSHDYQGIWEGWYIGAEECGVINWWSLGKYNQKAATIKDSDEGNEKHIKHSELHNNWLFLLLSLLL